MPPAYPRVSSRVSEANRGICGETSQRASTLPKDSSARSRCSLGRNDKPGAACFASDDNGKKYRPPTQHVRRMRDKGNGNAQGWDISPPLQVLQIALGAASIEELAGAGEILVLATQHQRPPQLDPASEVFEDGYGGVEVLARRLFISPRGM